MMRFTLTDFDNRLFSLERWCFLGSIDDWFFLAGPTPLPTLIKKYASHLGRKAFTILFEAVTPKDKHLQRSGESKQ